MLSVRNAVYESFKVKSQRAIRLHSCEVFLLSSHPLMLILCTKIALNAVICMFLSIFLDNRVMTTPKRRFLSFVLQFYNYCYEVIFGMDPFLRTFYAKMVPNPTWKENLAIYQTSYSNSLIIHQVKTKEITTVTLDI